MDRTNLVFRLGYLPEISEEKLASFSNGLFDMTKD